MMDPAVTFDLVLVHWFYSTLLAPLGSLFNCPLVWYAAGDACWASLQLVHELPSPAYSVGPHSHHLPSIPFTINDRITQLWQQLYFGFWTRYYLDYVEPPIYEATYAAAMRVRGLVPPPYDLVAKNGSTLLLNSHPPLGQSLPLPLNAKLVGGHHLRPLKPLPEKFQIFMDNAKHGLIFMELGAGVESSDMPQHVRKRLLDMFGELQHQVVWRLDERPPHAARNVHVLERAPALEMLCHPNTLMVITDGSTTSLMEALHCGVPVITVPFLGDQFLNADIAVAQGFAIKVEFTHHFAWKLREAIGEILGNNSYRSSAKEASRMFHLRPSPAAADLLHWIEVTSSTGAWHLRSAARHLSLAERYYLDLGLLLVLAVWFLSKVVKVIRVHLKDDDCNKKDD
ncbi:unnamed protein product [Chilo suppressalis]|nr:unnamed protein product [Chilo suppressalis]